MLALLTHKLVFFVFIDATTLIPELTNGWVENVPITNKTQKILLFIICFAFFEGNYIFFEKLNTSSRS